MDRKNKVTHIPPHAVHSGHFLVIVPRNSKFRPSDAQIKASLHVICKEYSSCEITSEIYDSVTFVDSGENFDKVYCNHCNKEMLIGFWQEKMDESYHGSNFEEMDFRTQCCNSMSNLNDLIYYGDCGFASYSLSINNAEPDDQKKKEIEERLTQTLSTEIKVFWKNI